VKVENEGTTPGINLSLSPVYYLDAAGGDMAGVQRNAMIFGTVSDDNGEVIQDAAVYLLDEAGEPVAFARSDSDGAYEFPGVPPGQYMIQVSQLGYESVYYEGAEPGSGGSAVIEVSGAPMQIDFSLDPAEATEVEDPEVIPETFVLLGNYPNPFNPQTRISFRVPVESEIQVRIFNTLGQQVRVLQAGRRSPGESSIEWNGLGSSGHELPSGVYLYVMEADGKPVGRSSMVLLR
jgi:hypothetical protein